MYELLFYNITEVLGNHLKHCKHTGDGKTQFSDQQYDNTLIITQIFQLR